MPTRVGIEHAQELYEETRTLQGETHPDTLDALSEVAKQYQLVGDLVSAKSIQEQVVLARTEIWGEGDYGTFRARHLLAGFISDLGELDQARSMQDELLAEAFRYFPEDAEVTFPATVNLANTLYRAGEYERAAELYGQAVSLGTSVHGADNKLTIQVMGGWVLALRKLGKNVQARAVEKDRRQRERRRIARGIRLKVQRRGPTPG